MLYMKKATTYEDKINNLVNKIKKADVIVVGIGAGMTASGGINYSDEKLLKKWLPQYYDLGFISLMELQGMFWFWNKKEKDMQLYWGYWARHIEKIRFQTPLLEPYKNLEKLIKDKNYFIISTNADGQLEKSDFDKNKIFSMQGNYGYLQCMTPCTDEIYESEEYIKKMTKSIENNRVSMDTVPRCPHCGNYLIPNLRCDDTFVEKPHMKNSEKYRDFLRENINKNILFLELGVGYNTPVIIRYPFEKMTYNLDKSTLARVNKGMATVSKEIEDKSISLDEDINKVLLDVIKNMN